MKTKLFYVFLVFALLFGVVGCAAQEEPEEQEADYYEFVPAPVTPTPEPEEDPWYQGLLDCAPVGVLVEEYEGNLWGVDQFFRDLGTPDVDVSPYLDYYFNYVGMYSVWRYYYLRQTDFTPEDVSYGHHWIWNLLPSKRIESLSLIPEGKRVKVWNRNGIIADGYSGLEMGVSNPYLCYPDIRTEGLWYTDPADLKYRTSFHVPSRKGTEVTALIYEGETMDGWDLNHLSASAFYDEAVGAGLDKRASVESWVLTKRISSYSSGFYYYGFDLRPNGDLYYEPWDGDGDDVFVVHLEDNLEYVIFVQLTYLDGTSELVKGRFVVATPHANSSYRTIINIYEATVQLPEDALTRLDDR